MNIFQKVRELHLPPGEYVVVGGAVLVAVGLLKCGEDVDITVSPELFEEFQRQGWEREAWQDIPVLKRGIYDIGTRFGAWGVGDLLLDALVIDEISFMSLEKLLEWKLQMGRPKDLIHAELIKDYQRRHRADVP